jgi:hypothetical protein
MYTPALDVSNGLRMRPIRSGRNSEHRILGGEKAREKGALAARPLLQSDFLLLA